MVDVEAVGLDAERNDVGAKLPQCARGNAIGCAVGAIDDNAQSVERQVARQRALGEFDVAVVHAVDAAGAAEVVALGEFLGHLGVDQLLDAEFDFVGKFVTVRAEQLDAVVVERVVGRRDHHPEIGTHRTRQHRYRRRRHRAEQQHVHADGSKAGNQRGLDHVAGQPGVFADHHAMAMLAATETQARGLPDLERQFRRNDSIGKATDAVCAEILANHTRNPAARVPRGWILTRSVSQSVQNMLDILTMVNNRIFTMATGKA